MAVAIQMPDPVAWHNSAEGPADDFAIQLSNGAVFFIAGFSRVRYVRDAILKGETIFGSFIPRNPKTYDSILNIAHVVAITDLRSRD